MLDTSDYVLRLLKMIRKIKGNKGSMFFHTEILKAYDIAKTFAGKRGRVATMPDIIGAKSMVDEWNPLWTKYTMTTSGEFYGESKEGIPIVVVSHGIDDFLNNEELMNYSKKNSGRWAGHDKTYICLTSKEFHKLEDGKFGDITIVEVSNILAQNRKYLDSVLSYEEALQDPLLKARLGSNGEKFLVRHKEITKKESENDFILTNNCKYQYEHQRIPNTGGLLVITQLCNYQRSGEEREKSGVSSEIYLTGIDSCGRFVAVHGKEPLIDVNNRLESILDNIGKNWKKLSIPFKQKRNNAFYVLMENGNEFFTQYPKNGAGLDTAEPEFHVKSLKRIGGTKQFKTEIKGYYGFFKYGVSDVKKIMPKGANAYLMGEPKLLGEFQVAPIEFYHADVDTSKRILKDEEIKENSGLIKSLLR